MTGEQAALTGIASATEHATELRSRGDDPTPRGVVRAVLAAASEHGVFDWDGHCVNGDTLRVLDVCAGYGCWASEMRRLAASQGWPVHITGVEIHEPRREHLRKWCDDVWVDDWKPEPEPPDTPFGYRWTGDIAIGNPDFALVLRDAAGNVLPVEQTMVAVLLRHAPAVLLLHTQQAFVKSEPGRACYRAYPPAASWLLPGSIKFRRGINPDTGKPWGADSRCYQVSLWLRGHTGPCSTYMLEDLESHVRAWVVPPGSEDPSADLPARPGWSA